MSEIVIFQNDYATMVYHPEKKIVHHGFNKPFQGEEFRKMLNSGTEYLRQHGAQKWLSDDRNNSVISPEDTEWSKEWFVRTQEAGWKFWGLVVPNDMYARLNLTQFVHGFSQQGIRVMVFTDPDKAMAWLEAQ
jgi:hypothetical protein